jgi:hypothetical protein
VPHTTTAIWGASNAVFFTENYYDFISMPLFPSKSAVTTKPAMTPSPLPINLTANKWNAHGYMERCFNYEKAHFLYLTSYSFLFDRFVQCIVIGLRTTERERRNKKNSP